MRIKIFAVFALVFGMGTSLMGHGGRIENINASSSGASSTSPNFIHNSDANQDAEFNVSTGTVRGKLIFKDGDDDDSNNSYFIIDGNDFKIYVHGELRQTWTTELLEGNFLLESGDNFLLEGGDKLILG